MRRGKIPGFIVSTPPHIKDRLVLVPLYGTISAWNHGWADFGTHGTSPMPLRDHMLVPLFKFPKLLFVPLIHNDAPAPRHQSPQRAHMT